MTEATIKPRRWWAALLLTWAGFGLGYLYVGQPKKAFTVAAVIVGYCTAFSHGLWGVLAMPWVVMALIAITLATIIFTFVDAIRIARRSAAYQLRWYNRWWVYTGAAVAGVAFLSLPDLTGLQISIRVFNFPSSSMEPNVRVGEFGIADMHAYRTADPQRGDVVIFKLPRDPRALYIKRIIGMPGETLQMKGGIVTINGLALPAVATGTHEVKDSDQPAPDKIDLKQETLPGGRVISILKAGTRGQLDDTEAFNIPPGHYFTIGDNRDNSTDSRVRQEFGVGYVPRANVIGKLSWICWSRDLSRIGQRIE
jgi:signal peptidase I